MAQSGAPWSAQRTRVGVVAEHDILRYGLVACLAEDRGLEVIAASSPEELDGRELDIAIVSSRSASHCFPCPIILYGVGVQGGLGAVNGNAVAGALNPATLTLSQLHATVHAAAAGLRVERPADDASRPLDERSVQLLEYLAAGFSTREIAERMSYSERTIKKFVTDLQDRLDARSRAQVVAQAIRLGII